MKLKYKQLMISVLLICSLLGACGSARYENVDYSLSSRWLSLPSSIDKGVDVFYLYPTAWQKTNPSDPGICDIDNPSMLHGSGLAFNRQATAFEPIANIFAPYYRQVDLSLSKTTTTGGRISWPATRKARTCWSICCLDT